MLPPRFLVFLAAGSLALGSCSIFHRKKAEPIVETVRTESSPTPPTAARDLADVMATDLQLTPEQTTQVRAILSSTVAQVNAAKEKLPPKSPQLMTELRRINTTSQKELRVVLGPAKFKQLQVDQRKMATEMQQRQAQPK